MKLLLKGFLNGSRRPIGQIDGDDGHGGKRYDKGGDAPYGLSLPGLVQITRIDHGDEHVAALELAGLPGDAQIRGVAAALLHAQGLGYDLVEVV